MEKIKYNYFAQVYCKRSGIDKEMNYNFRLWSNTKGVYNLLEDTLIKVGLE